MSLARLPFPDLHLRNNCPKHLFCFVSGQVQDYFFQFCWQDLALPCSSKSIRRCGYSAHALNRAFHPYPGK